MTDTHGRSIIIVLDRSGSMATVKTDAEGGLRSFLDQQTDVPGGTLVTLVTLRQFDTEHETVFQNVPLAQVPDFTLVPRGMTALLDAVGSTIAEVSSHLAALPEQERPGEVIVVIVTDGLENSSVEWTLDAVNDSITRQRDRHGWRFVFLGADQDAIRVAGRMGISRDTSLSYSSDSTEDSMTSAGRMVARGSRTGSYAFTDDERASAAGTNETSSGDSTPAPGRSPDA